jgi:hypothetical protein
MILLLTGVSLLYWTGGVGQIKVRLENEVLAENGLRKAIGIDGNL